MLGVLDYAGIYDGDSSDDEDNEIDFVTDSPQKTKKRTFKSQRKSKNILGNHEGKQVRPHSYWPDSHEHSGDSDEEEEHVFASPKKLKHWRDLLESDSNKEEEDQISDNSKGHDDDEKDDTLLNVLVNISYSTRSVVWTAER